MKCIKWDAIRHNRVELCETLGPNPALDTKYVPSIMYHASSIMFNPWMGGYGGSWNTHNLILHQNVQYKI